MTPFINVVVAIAAWASPAHAQVQQPRYQPGWPCSGTVDPAYVSTAEATGGAVLLFAPSEISGLVLEDAVSNRHPEVVFRASDLKAADGLHEFDVPLDSSIESVYFFISLQCLEGISIIGPSGDEVRTDGQGVELHAFDAIRLLTVSSPPPGQWKLRLAGRGFLSVIIRAKTDLRLASVKFADASRAHRKPQRLEATVDGSNSPVAFHAVSARADLLKLLPLELEAQEDSRRTYGGTVTAPAVDFRVAVTGTDGKGFRFQRMQNTLIVE